MRILYPFVGDTVGGSHHSAKLLIQAVRGTNVTPIVLVHKRGYLDVFFRTSGVLKIEEGSLPYWENKGGVWRNIIKFFTVCPKLIKFLRENRVDIVHVNDGRMAISWSLACLLARVPMVVHQRTQFSYSRISLIALRCASRIIAISEFTRDSLPEKFKEHTEVVYNPFLPDFLDRKIARSKINAEFGLNPAASVLLFVGTIQKQKRLNIALAALRHLQLGGKTAILLVAGRISKKQETLIREQLEIDGLGEQVHLLGYRSDIKNLLAAADLLVAPAVNEGHGRAVAEAMALGTPVVVSSSGGHPEIVDHKRTGLLFAPDDALELADCISSLLGDTAKCLKLAEAAREFVQKNYSIATHVERVREIYRELYGNVTVVIESMGGGGAQQVVSRLLVHWSSKGEIPHLITFQDTTADEMFVPSSVIRKVVGGAFVSSSLIEAIISNFWRILSLRKEICASQSRVVVSFVTTTNVLVLLACLGTNVRVVVSERNDPTRQNVGRCWSLLRSVTYLFAWRVTANSQFALDALAKPFSSQKHVMVPNPIRVDLGTDIVSVSYPFILAVGRLHEQKNFGLLIRAFSRAIQNSLMPVGWKLLIAGDGPERGSLERLISDLKLEKNVLLLGHIRDPYTYMRSASMFVMCSQYEGSPNALWEAMTCGLPTIITDSIIGALEVAEHGTHTYVVPHNDKVSLSDAIIYLAKDYRLRSRLGKEARDVSKKFSDEYVFSIWDELVYGR